MKCITCGGTAEKSTMEYIHKTGNHIIIIDNIPCEKCIQCGEEYLSDDAAQNIENFINASNKATNQLTVTVFDYKKPNSVNKYKCIKCDEHNTPTDKPYEDEI